MHKRVLVPLDSSAVLDSVVSVLELIEEDRRRRTPVRFG
jgi:hypothetical protein